MNIKISCRIHLFAGAMSFFLILFTNKTIAQSTRIDDHNNIVWCNLFATIPIHNKWSFHSDIQNRMVDGIKNQQQMLYRFGVNYEPVQDLLFRFGGAYVQTFPYSEHPLNSMGKKTEELRAFQMVSLSQSLQSLKLWHRLMLEERWNGKFNSINSQNTDSWVLSGRLRFMERFEKNISKNKPFYLTGYNELFISFGNNVGENIFDQNRFTLMLGYRFNKLIRTEAGFLSQIQQLSREINNSNVIHYNRGLIINTYLNL